MEPTAEELASCFTVTISKSSNSESAGATICLYEDRTLTVTALKETGLFADWNAKNTEQIQVGDAIYLVNGVGGDGKKMLDALKGKGEFEIYVKHTSMSVSEVKADALAEPAPAPAPAPAPEPAPAEPAAEETKPEEKPEPVEDKKEEGSEPAVVNTVTPVALTSPDEVYVEEPQEVRGDAAKGVCCF